MIREVISYKELSKLDNLDWSCICFDTETTSLRQDELEITGLSLCDGNYNYYLPVTPEQRLNIMSTIKEYFSLSKKIIGHNIVFDLRVLYKYGINFSLGTKLFDTMVAAHLINENDKKGLKHLTRTILGISDAEDYDEKLSHYSEKFYQYGLNDSYYTWKLYEHFLPLLKVQGLERLFFKIEMPFQFVLLEMAIEGVLINKELLIKQQGILEKEITGLEIEMLDLLGERYTMQLSLDGNPFIVSKINFNSTLQLIKIFNTLGIEITDKTPSGSPSVGVKTIQKHLDNPFVATLNKYKIAKKLYDAFISPSGQIALNIELDGKIRPSFRDTGTKTGRLSCSNPNLQQLPKPKEYSPVEVRKLFVAPKGYKMFSCDYSGQEVAVMAQQSKDETLVKALNNGYDMHLAIANQFYNLGIPEEVLSKKHPSYKECKKEHNKKRSLAKTITFGLAYGKGSYGFSKDFGITEDEAQKIVDDYFRGMPQLKESINNAHKEIEDHGQVTSMAGRIRHFDITADSDKWYVEKCKRQSFNFQIQGFSADMIRAAMVNVIVRKNNHPEWGLKTIMTVHDEAVYIVKNEYINDATALVKESFESVGKNFIVPVNADVEVGDNYGEAK